MNYYRAYIVVCLLVVAAAFAPALAQGAHKGVVIESVDEDVVEGDAPHKKTPAKKELDLDVLLGTDDADDLLVEEEKVIAPVAVDSTSIDTSAVKSSELAGDENTQTADSAEQAVHGRRGGRHSASKAASKTDTAGLGPIVIEDGRSINFAYNLKEYRSPRIAMLLSLLVPGLGQAYARSYVKAGAFGAAELATIGVAVYFNVMGKAKYKEAKDFADKHYDVGNMQKYDEALREEFEKRVGDGRLKPEEDSVDIEYFFQYYDSSFYNAAKAKESYYYERIRDIYFTPGWDDSYPPLEEVLKLSEPSGGVEELTDSRDGSKYVLAYDSTKSRYYKYQFYLLTRMVGNSARNENILGYSSNQAEYNAKMNKSNSYYDAVNYTFYVLLLNHIASAIDAGFTARSYNAKLLGQESVWDRLSVEQTYVYTGSGMSPGLALGWRF